MSSFCDNEISSIEKETKMNMESVRYRAPVLAVKQRKLENAYASCLITPTLLTLSKAFASHGAEVRITGKVSTRSQPP